MDGEIRHCEDEMTPTEPRTSGIGEERERWPTKKAMHREEKNGQRRNRQNDSCGGPFGRHILERPRNRKYDCPHDTPPVTPSAMWNLMGRRIRNHAWSGRGLSIFLNGLQGVVKRRFEPSSWQWRASDEALSATNLLTLPSAGTGQAHRSYRRIATHSC